MIDYRTNPRPQPTLPRKTSWRLLALWWATGGPKRLERARFRRDPHGEIVKRIDRLRAMFADLEARHPYASRARHR